jgi:hypothetical protein
MLKEAIFMVWGFGVRLGEFGVQLDKRKRVRNRTGTRYFCFITIILHLLKRLLKFSE